jgi:ankyrin repeat protein
MDNISLLGIFKGELIELFFLPSVDENPTNDDHKIPQHDLFQSLLNQNTQSSILREIDHKSKIIEVETHRQRGKPNTNNSTKPSVDIFMVFKTASEKDGESWWSLEKTAKNAVILQRSRNKNEVKNQLKGETREGIQLIAEELEGKGCMRQLLTLLWIHMIVDAKYQRYLSRCESLIPLIMKKITKIRYEYETDFTYSALSAEERNPDLSEMINFLSNVSNWHPLVISTYLGDVNKLDELKQDAKYNINDIYNNFTLLNLAILFSKTKMFQHLLEKLKADPTKCDEKGRNALHMAAKFNNETEIINLLLKNKKIKIDQCDRKGTTALHHAVMASNTEIVKCLLDNDADPKRLDQIGRSPLCLAASYATDTKIIDLLLENKEIIDVNECDKFGDTTLHLAAMASNVTTARHLLAKGADINRRDKRGLTPLHVAAFFAKDMELINLFLNDENVDLHYCDELGQNIIAYALKNTYKLRQEIIERVKEKDNRVIKEYNLLKLATSEIHIPISKRIVGTASTSHFLSGLIASLTKNYKWKLFYVPFADLKPGKGIEISESVLIRNIADRINITQANFSKSEMCNTTKLLGDLNLHLKITQVQICESSNNSIANLIKVVHYFIIFQTTSDKDGDHWWSLERKVDHIVLQRSRNKDAVTNKIGGKERNNLKINIQDLVEKCSIKDLLTILWIHQVMEEFNLNESSNSQSFVTLVSKAITKMGDEDHFAHQSDGTLDLISTLASGICNWHPLYLPIYLGNAKLFDRIKEMTNFNHFNNEISMLNLAIAFPNKTEMVRQILENYSADPTKRDASGRNTLEMAAMCANNTEIIDLLLKHVNVKINDCDEHGQTALHLAAASSNEITAKHLIKMGADPNGKDKLGRTPLHLAAFFAKDINIVNVFLNSKQIDVNALDNDERNALCYAKFNKINDEGLKKEIVSRLEEKGIEKTRSSNSDPALELEIQQYSNPELDKFLTIEKMESKNGGKRKKNLPDPLQTATQSCKSSKSAILSKLQIFKYLTLSIFFVIVLAYSTFHFSSAMFRYFNGEFRQKLFFVPDADNKPNEKHEISEAALFRFLLNEENQEKLDENEIPEMLGILKDIDKNSKIAEVEIHQSSMSSATDFLQAFHVFIVFKTTSEIDEDYWWSLEKRLDYIDLKRCKNQLNSLCKKDSVKKKFNGEMRKRVKPIKEQLTGKGTIKDLFAILWAQQMIEEKFHILYSNCKSFVTFVGKQITQEEYEYQGYFKYSPPREIDRYNIPSGKRQPPKIDQNTEMAEMLDFNDILSVTVRSWHPLFSLIYLENTQKFDRVTKGEKYNMGITQHGLPSLHFAIRFLKTKMVQHLLQDLKVDPTRRDVYGRNALHFAAIATRGTEIFDLLLAHPKVQIDDVDGDGQTALHIASHVSNVAAVEKLIEKGANPNIVDKHGMTALHCATMTSNEITAGQLINKGADIHRDTEGYTPLHMAAYFAKDMKIIDLLLKNIKHEEIDQYKKDAMLLPCAYCNEHGLGEEILNQLVAKGMVSKEQVQNPRVLEAMNAVKQQVELRRSKSNELARGGAMANLMEEAGSDQGKRHLQATGEKINEINNFNKGAGIADTSIGDNAVKWQDKFRMVLQMALANAIVDSDYEKTSKLSQKMKTDISTLTWGKHKCNALHLASNCAKATHFIDVVRAMGEFDINGVDNDGWTPLHYAIVGTNPTIIVPHLLQNRADPNIAENAGITPFHLAAAFGRDTDILELIMANNTQFDIDHQHHLGMTALHMAISESNTVTASYLLSKRAHPNTVDQHGYTPLHVAAKYAKDLEIVELLLNREEVDVNYLDKSGHVALDYAENNEHGLGEAIANLLKEKNEKPTDLINEPESIPARLDAVKASNVKTNIPIQQENRPLIKMEANPCIADKNRVTPLQISASDAESTNVNEKTPTIYLIMDSLISRALDPINGNKTKVSSLTWGNLLQTNSKKTHYIFIL